MKLTFHTLGLLRHGIASYRPDGLPDGHARRDGYHGSCFDERNRRTDKVTKSCSECLRRSQADEHRCQWHDGGW